MIKELIEKYGMEAKDYDLETFYYWEIEGTKRRGSAIRIINQSGEIYAANRIEIIKNGYILAYQGWEQIELKDLEERMKLLKYSYNRALLRYKKYIMEDKMETIEKDF